VSDLAARQAALVRAMVAGEPLPEGFDARLVGMSARALLRKRAGEVLRAWPQLAGETWSEDFCAWAATRPTEGSWRDGWSFARDHRATLPPQALVALAVAEARFCYDTGERRRGLAVRAIPGGLVVCLRGRVRVFAR
jgi:hypothetical protein